ncbi:MAG: amino acid adenylation domain-containing protein [Blastocatellia bacterium]
MQQENAMAEDLFVFPTSFGQQRIWLIEQLDPGTSIHNIPVALRMKGVLDVAALEESLNQIQRRHEVLRTSFATMDGRAVQIVHPPCDVRLPVVSLQSISGSDDEAKITIMARQEAQQPFDLSTDMPLRAKLLRVDDHDHVLLLTVHHIAADGWSMGVLTRELCELYRTLLSGNAPQLPDLPIQYADFAHWQREYLQGEVLRKQLDYWKQKLGGRLPVLELPFDHPRQSIRTSDGAAQILQLSESLTDELKTVSRQQGVTLFMTLLSAFGVLLHRYSGQKEILIGTPIANRSFEETERLIGLFINNLAIRVDLNGDPCFRELLHRIRNTSLEAYANQDVPFEKLVEELQPERNLSHTPVFQVLLALQNSPMPALELPGVTASGIELHNGKAKFDLALLVEEREGALFGILEYNTDLFEEATISRMLAHFELLLEGAIRDIDLSVSQLPLVSEAERHQLLLELNDTRGDYTEGVCIHDLFEAHAIRSADSIAVYFEGSELSYGDLNQRANQLAHYIRKIGVGPEVLVGLFMDRSIEMIIAILGILKAGGAYVPLDATYPKQRLAFMLEDSGVSVLLTMSHLAGALPENRARVVLLDAEDDAIASQSDENPVSGVTPDNLAYVIYTSGSTGRPKGTMIRHESLVSYTETVTERYGVVAEDRVLQFCSISFDISVEEIFPCLTSGAVLALRTDAMVSSAQTFLEKAREWELTFMSLPTAYWHELTAALETNGFILPPSLRVIIIAGERALPERLSIWHEAVQGRVRLINTYGLTESTVVSTICELTDPALSNTGSGEVSIGRPMRNSEVYLMDSNQQPVPIGVHGEMYLGGLLLARGYFKRPEATSDRFIPDPFSFQAGARLYRTGDLARLLPDGDIEFLGRVDNQVKIRGFRVELHEVELAINEHPSVHESIAVVREDMPGRKRIVAYVVAKQGQDVSSSDLRSFLYDGLPEYMVPHSFVMLDTLPLSPNGKLDRAALPAPQSIRPEMEVFYVAPRDEIEQALATIWQEALQVEKVGVHDNFFELGGHSLLLLQVHAKMRELFKRDLPIVELFQYPSISSLAKYLSDGQAEQSSDGSEAVRAESSRRSTKRRRDARLRNRAEESNKGGTDE